MEKFTQGKENKEKETLPPVFIIYRDNDLYSDLVPKLVKNFELMGRKVEIKSFSAGTPTEEINKSLDAENQEELGKAEILSDDTCRPLLYSRKLPNAFKENSLDAMSTKIMTEYFGKNILDEDRGIEKFDSSEAPPISKQLEVLNKVIDYLINKRGAPDKITIVESSISAHGFKSPIQIWGRIGKFIEKREDGNYTEEELETYFQKDAAVREMIDLGLFANKQEVFQEILQGKKHFHDRIEKERAEGLSKEELDKRHIESIKNRDSEAATMIKESLSGLIGEDKVRIVSNIEELNDETNNEFVLIDRHAEPSNDFSAEIRNYGIEEAAKRKAIRELLEKKVKLPLPVSSMIGELVQKRYLPFDDTEIDVQINRVLEKKFSGEK